MPILLNGAFSIIFTDYNINQLYINASEDLKKYLETFILILEDKDLNLDENIKKENRVSLEKIYDSFKKIKNKIEENLDQLLNLNKLKLDNEEFVKNVYEFKSEEYKKNMNYKDYCDKVENLIYKNIVKNSKKNINNTLNICFNMFLISIIKEGVKEQFKEKEKDVISEIYHELFKNLE